jgi:hypothetical protein
MNPSDRRKAFRETRDRRVSNRYLSLTADGYLKPLSEVRLSDSAEDVTRYGFRSFDRQWVIADGRLGDFMKPVLWNSLSDQQVFMVTLTVNPLGAGPAATASAYVPDMPFFRGSYGSKDVIPLYRSASGDPNVSPTTLTVLASIHETGQVTSDVLSRSLFAYCFGVLAGTDYTHRFNSELTVPNSCRIPITRDRRLFAEMVAYGEELLWLQTFGERFQTKQRSALKIGPGIRWLERPSRLPADSKDITYDIQQEVLHIGDGKLAGVTSGTWDFEVSGLQVIKKWLSYRTAKGSGKSASSDSPLDKIRPTSWEPEWSEELREIVHVLTETEAIRPKGIELLDRIMAGGLISADELPQPPEELRKPPRTSESGELFD